MSPTAEQQRLIDSNAPNLLGIAGPGSGKTGTAALRVLRLIRDGVDPEDIAVICYTNDAASEFNRRLHPESGEYAINLGFCGTEHSFCLRHLQEFAGMKNVTVLDDEEANEELMRSAKQAGVKATERELTKCRENWPVESAMPQTAVRIAVGSYYRRMRGSQALDYNAILTTAMIHLAKQIGTDIHEQRKWKHLIIDEGQDHSAQDFAIFFYIDAENRCIVADVDQAAFGWRGGDPSIIVRLASDPKWETILLEGNFRSAQPICDVAQRLIEHNKDRVPKRLVSLRPQTAQQCSHKPFADLTNSLAHKEALAHESDVSEAVWVAGEILSRIGMECIRHVLDSTGTESATSASPEDFAVLARTNYIAARAAETIEAHRIPVRRRTRADMPQDWQRAKAALRMIQTGTEDAIVRHERLLQNEGMAEALRRAFAQGKQKAATYIAGLERTLTGMSRDLQRLSISWDSIERVERIAGKLVKPTYGDVLLAANQSNEEETETPGVFCGTVHSAKGREFETVFIIGAEQETWPGMKPDADIEEERRLFYIAMTRAKTTLIISHAKQRRAQWGRNEYQERTVSRFVAEAGL